MLLIMTALLAMELQAKPPKSVGLDPMPPRSNPAPAPASDPDPNYLIRPVPEFPPRAMQQGVTSGSARIRCHVNAGGIATDCVVTSESPAEMGFGAEAIRAMRRARLAEGTPRTIAQSFNFSMQ